MFNLIFNIKLPLKRMGWLFNLLKTLIFLTGLSLIDFLFIDLFNALYLNKRRKNLRKGLFRGPRSGENLGESGNDKNYRYLRERDPHGSRGIPNYDASGLDLNGRKAIQPWCYFFALENIPWAFLANHQECVPCQVRDTIFDKQEVHPSAWY